MATRLSPQRLNTGDDEDDDDIVLPGSTGSSSHGRPNWKSPFRGQSFPDLLLLSTWCVVYCVTAAEGQGRPPFPSNESFITAHGHSPYILALAELAKHAGVTDLSTCKDVLPAVISRNPDAHVSSLLCARSSALLDAFTQVRSKCVNDSLPLYEQPAIKSAYKASIRIRNEGEEAWSRKFREINGTILSCCGDIPPLSNSPRFNNNSVDSYAADCLLNASLSETFNHLNFSDLVLESPCGITLDRTLDASVQVPGLISLLNSTDVSDFLNHALQELKWLITNLRGKELNEIRESFTSLYALESSLSLTTGVNFNWTDAPETLFSICNVITAISARDDPLPACSSVCERNRRLLKSLAHFINISKTPIFNVLSEATIPCGPENLNPSQHCIKPNSAQIMMRNGTTNRAQNDQKSVAGGFCFTVGCKVPLKETKHSSRWLKTVQSDLRNIYDNVRQAFPNASLKFNASLWPCGEQCTAEELSDAEQTGSHIFVSLCSIINLSTAILVVVVFYYNRRKLAHVFIFRVLVCYSIAGGLENLASVTPVFDYKSIICYSDGVLILDQPGDKPACGFLGWLSHYGAVLTTGYFLVIIYAWQKFTRDIDQPGFARKTHVNSLWLKYREDALSFVLVNVPALVLTSGALATKVYEGVPEVGMCLLGARHGGSNYFYAFYELFILFPSLIFLLKGLKYLQHHKRKGEVKAGALPPTNTTARSTSTSSGSRNKAAFKQMSRRLRYVLVFVLVSAAVNAFFAITVFILSDELKRKSRKHHVCILTSCTPEDCPGHLVFSIEVIVLFWLISTLRFLLLSSWALRPRLLTKIPYFRAVVRRYSKRTSSHCSRTSDNDLTTVLAGTVVVNSGTSTEQPMSRQTFPKVSSQLNFTLSADDQV